jgi:hypothetical protein
MKNKILITVIIIGIMLALLAPYLLTRNSYWGSLDFNNTGPIGDTIGGITAPILNFINIILLFYSFNEQFKANQEQMRVLTEEKLRNQLDKNFRLILDLFNNFKDESEKLPIDEMFHQFNSEDINTVIINNRTYDIMNIKSLLEIGKSVLSKIRTIELIEDDKNFIMSITNHYFASRYETLINNITNTSKRCSVCNNIHQTPKVLTNTLKGIQKELEYIHSQL